MTRIFTPALLVLLLALLLLPACATTQRDVAVITLCIAGFAGDIAISVATGTPGPGGLLGLLVCDVGEAAITAQSLGGTAPPQIVAGEESSR